MKSSVTAVAFLFATLIRGEGAPVVGRGPIRTGVTAILIFLAFSTANREVARTDGIAAVEMVPNDEINGLFYATVRATEEAEILRRHGRLQER